MSTARRQLAEVALCLLSIGFLVSRGEAQQLRDWDDALEKTEKSDKKRPDDKRKRKKTPEVTVDPEDISQPPTPPTPPVQTPPAEATPPSAPPETNESQASAEVALDNTVATADKPKKVRFEFRGFLFSQGLYAYQAEDYGLRGAIPVRDNERLFIEANLQPKMKVLENRFTLALDLSAYLGSAEPKHLILLNELYAESQVAGPLYILAGRKRIVWGPGLAFNPMDILNPLKNPIDLSLQRTGAFLLPLVEIATKYITLSALVAPSITTNDWSLPDGMDFKKPIAGGRIYALAGGTDINAVYFYDWKRERHYWGASVSRVFKDILELHAESMMWYGPSAPIAIPSIIPAVVQCGAYLPEKKVNGSVIAGGRVDFIDQTYLSFEYLYNGDGLSPSDYDRFYDRLDCIRSSVGPTPPPLPNAVGHPIDPAIALFRQHYGILAFDRPHLTKDLFENVSIGASLIWGFLDYSVLLLYRVGYKFAGDATVSINVGGWIAPGQYRSEFGLLPNRFVGTATVRVPF